MKKIIKTILPLLLTSIFVLFSVGCKNGIQEINGPSYTVNLPQRDAKIYCNATIDDDFEEDSLVVKI